MSDRYCNKCGTMLSHRESEQCLACQAQSELAAPSGYATSSILGGINLKDIRDAVLKCPHVPKLSWVRVSDGWWVVMEDDKPTGFIPHGDLMRVIEENFKTVGHNDKLRHGGDNQEHS